MLFRSEPMGSGLDGDKGIECCFFIGDPYASVIAEENPRFRKCSQEEAVEIMRRSHDSGAVQMAFWKKELNRNFYSICNCCRCCCGNSVDNMIAPLTNATNFLSKVTTELCIGCGTCAKVCHTGAAFLGDDKKARRKEELCIGCGVCASFCPANAISLIEGERIVRIPPQRRKQA